MKSNRPADQIVRAVQEGFGGVFTYTPSTPAGSGYLENWDVIRLIGTWGLITCVGLYFAIDDNRCFLTHINSLVDVGEEKTARICNSAEGAAVKQRVLQGLKTSARVDDWDLSAPKVRDSIKVFCPNMHLTDNERDGLPAESDFHYKVG